MRSRVGVSHPAVRGDASHPLARGAGPAVRNCGSTTRHGAYKRGTCCLRSLRAQEMALLHRSLAAWGILVVSSDVAWHAAMLLRLGGLGARFGVASAHPRRCSSLVASASLVRVAGVGSGRSGIGVARAVPTLASYRANTASCRKRLHQAGLIYPLLGICVVHSL